MDGNRFDAISRALGAGVSRRGALRIIAAVVAGGSATRLADDAAAIPSGPSRRSLCRVPFAGCTKDGQCCTGTCMTSRSLPRSQRNRCACDNGLTPCNGFCVDIETDINHCGACGNVCAATEWCVSGVCECKRLCNGRECGDDSCGGTCGTCTDDNTCIDGACLCDGAVCADGTKCCDETCLDTSDDNANCGACGNVCGAAERCLDSTCVGICYLRPMGYLTKGNQFFEANSSTYSYTTPMPAWDPPLTNTSCTVDSDCSSCPTQVRTSGTIKTVVGCGCQHLLCIGGSAIAPFNAGNCAVYGAF
jgi:hypothetical protein